MSWGGLCIDPRVRSLTPQLVGTRVLGFPEPSAPALLSLPGFPAGLGACKAGLERGLASPPTILPQTRFPGPGPGAAARHGISGSSLRGRLLCSPSQFSKKIFFFPFLNVSL